MAKVKNKNKNTDQPDTPEQFETGVPYPPPPGYSAGTNNTYPEPLTTTPHFDNPKNPRGIPSSMCNGVPDNYALDAQKIENPTPARTAQPYTTAGPTDPLWTTSPERVSAGQNRKPPQEVIP